MEKEAWKRPLSQAVPRSARRPPVPYARRRAWAVAAGAPCGCSHAGWCGRRHSRPWSVRVIREQMVSIHAPRAGGDSPYPRNSPSRLFQSTPPARGATDADFWSRCYHWVSIHAPRAGGDHMSAGPSRLQLVSIHAPRAGGDMPPSRSGSAQQCFNPRPPRGGRL